MRYKIGKTPRIRSDHNKETWQTLESKLTKSGSASFDQIVAWCKDHDHPSGGEGFIRYCIDSEWLVQSDKPLNTQVSTSTEKLTSNQKIVRASSDKSEDSGIYIALLHTQQLMPVTRDSRYVDTCAKVNKMNVKVGKAKSFKTREKNYWKDFDEKNVEFIPIAQLDDIDRAETAIKKRLDRYRLLSPKGSKMDWLSGISPNDVVQVAYEVLSTGDFDYQVVKNRFLQS